MPTVRKSVIVPHGAQAMFALVDAVERYPEFLPCAAARRCSSARQRSRARASTSTTTA
jgi:ribosome-associated toxin RatA of RatAB toxin-antitoxin module